MKKFFSIISLLIALSVNAADEVEFYRMTNDIFGYLRIDQWIDYVKRIKTDDDIPSYYNFDMPDDKTNSYYKKFDIIGYESGLKKQIVKNISHTELTIAHGKLKNPFTAKILNILLNKEKTSLNFARRVLLAKDEKIATDRVNLIESIYNLLAYKSMADHMLKSIHAEEKQAEEISKLLQKDNENITVQKAGKYQRTKMKDVKKVFLVQINKALKSVSINEIRQFINMLKDESIQKIVGLYNTYDYFFIHKFNKMLYMREENDIKRGLKSNLK